MQILGISTATKVLSIGLIDDDKILIDHSVADPHAENLIAYMEKLGIEAKTINGVAVAQGPGSYSGLRGGLATAKTLSQTLNIPIAGISTLEAIAYNLVNIIGTILAVTDACKDDYNVALFRACDNKIERLTSDSVLHIDKLNALIGQIKGEYYFICNDPRLQTPDFRQLIIGEPLGINIAKLGLLKIKNNKTNDFLSLVPNYSHKPKFKEYAT